MTHNEAVEKVDFACEVIPTPLLLEAALPPEEIAPPIMDLIAMDSTPLDLPVPVPPVVTEIPPTYETASYIPPVFPPSFFGGGVGSGGTGSSVLVGTPVIVPVPAVTPVPEPPSGLLLMVGMGSVAFLWMRHGARSVA